MEGNIRFCGRDFEFGIKLGFDTRFETHIKTNHMPPLTITQERFEKSK